jgi:acetylglutamate kinase
MAIDGTQASARELTGTSRVRDHEVIAHVLHEAQPYIEALRGHTVVIKLGGSTLDDVQDALEDIVLLHSLGARPVLVHGGGSQISAWLERLGMPTTFIRGLRVTDADTLEVVRMVLVGKVNGELVQAMARLGGRAVGFSGIDGPILRARQLSPELGFVGTVIEVDPQPVLALAEAAYIPIIAPLALGQDGETLNVNADDAAADLARGLAATKLLYLSDVPGILGKDGELLSTLSGAEIPHLIADGTITRGMIPKAEACLRALDTVQRVHIIDGREPHVLLRELYTDRGAGTMIQMSQDKIPSAP